MEDRGEVFKLNLCPCQCSISNLLLRGDRNSLYFVLICERKENDEDVILLSKNIFENHRGEINNSASCEIQKKLYFFLKLKIFKSINKIICS